MQKTMFCLWLLCFDAVAQKTLESKIERVTVFQNGANVSRTAQMVLSAGKTEWVLKNISPDAEKQSVQVRGEGKFTILSAVYQVSYASVQQQDEIRKLNEQLDELNDKIVFENSQIEILEQEKVLLLKNQELSGKTNAVKVMELRESADFQRSRLTEILTKQLEIKRTLKKMGIEKQKINQQLTVQQSQNEKATGEILLTLSSKESTLANISFNYFVPSAGWTPSYDIRVQNIASPLLLTSKASVFQYSGEDWRDIRLTLSTAEPNKNGLYPQLPIWHWGEPYYPIWRQPQHNSSEISEVRGRILDPTKQPMPSVAVRLKGTNLTTQTDLNGYYKIAMPPTLKNSPKALLFTFVGMLSQEQNVYADELNVQMKEDSQPMPEVAVMYDAPAAISTPRIMMRSEADGAFKEARMQTIALDVQEKEATTSQQFEIQIPYTIPADGKVYAVEIKEQEVPAEYEYYAIPKLDKDAFLNAKIIHWEQYNLLNGEMNLYFEGTYLGKSVLNLDHTSDTLSLSLGRDKGISITRIKTKDFSKKQWAAANRIENIGYEIAVRNTKKQAIRLVLEDQFPISRRKEIEVYDQIAPEAQANSETGKVSWKINLPPAQEKKLQISYTVKMPKGSVAE